MFKVTQPVGRALGHSKAMVVWLNIQLFAWIPINVSVDVIFGDYTVSDSFLGDNITLGLMSPLAVNWRLYGGGET